MDEEVTTCVTPGYVTVVVELNSNAENKTQEKIRRAAKRTSPLSVVRLGVCVVHCTFRRFVWFDGPPRRRSERQTSKAQAKRVKGWHSLSLSGRL